MLLRDPEEPSVELDGVITRDSRAVQLEAINKNRLVRQGYMDMLTASTKVAQMQLLDVLTIFHSCRFGWVLGSSVQPA